MKKITLSKKEALIAAILANKATKAIGGVHCVGHCTGTL